MSFIFVNFTTSFEVTKFLFLVNMDSTHNSTPYHIPALLTETVELMEIRPDGVYIDATFGGGGHSRAILDRLGPDGRLFGFDRDIDALRNAPEDSRFTFVHSNFKFIPNFMRFYKVEKVDGILVDLGVSFHHFDTPERGFSFRADGPLDMRMNQASRLTAQEVIRKSKEELSSIIREHTDLRNADKIAAAISSAQNKSDITTTGQLAEVVRPLIDPKNFKKDLAQVFQALRITVNGEMDALECLLQASLSTLKRKGRLAILTYHSGEDRMVKEFFKGDEDAADFLIYGKKKSPWKLITTKAVTASSEEIEANPRARSAKLRVAQLNG